MAVGGIGTVQDRIGKIAEQIATIERNQGRALAHGPTRVSVPQGASGTPTSGGGQALPTAHAAGASPTAAAFQHHLAAQSLATQSLATQPAVAPSRTALPQAGNGLIGLGQQGSGLVGLNTSASPSGLGPMGLAGLAMAGQAPAGIAGAALRQSNPLLAASTQALAAFLQAGAQASPSAISPTNPQLPMQTNPFQGVGGIGPAAPGSSAAPGSIAGTGSGVSAATVAGAYGAQTALGRVSGGFNQAGPDPLTQGIAALPKGTHPAIPDRRGSKVPEELKGFGNGKIPADQLESVGVKDHQLWSPAAKAFKMMRAAAQRDGVQIGVNSSYRDVACQQCMVDKFGLYGQGGRAAPPGKSNHGWGLSIDLQLDSQAKAWMRANAKHYGFVEDVAREPWHWTFVADGDAVQANAQALLR